MSNIKERQEIEDELNEILYVLSQIDIQKIRVEGDMARIVFPNHNVADRFTRLVEKAKKEWNNEGDQIQ